MHAVARPRRIDSCATRLRRRHSHHAHPGVPVFVTSDCASPGALTDLTSVVSYSMGQAGGPFMTSVPSGPAGWSTYGYASSTTGTFTITNSGDATSVSIP
jgi:hypothetical protein